MSFHIHKFEADSQAAIKQRTSQNSPLDKANPYSAIGRVVSQHDALRSEAVSNARCKVETNVSKASLPEQIKHCEERPLAHVYTGTSFDRYQDCMTCTVSKDGQLEWLQYN